MNSFVHLHVHSRASILDASCPVDELAETAAKAGMSALALTDHNNLFNALSFYKACHKNKIKPILGVELNMVDDCAESVQLKIKDSYHIILLAENNTGWKNIIKLLNTANDEQHFYYTPRIDFKLLEQHKEGVIVLTSCHNGILNTHIKESAAGQFRAEAVIRKCLQFLDKDHFYIEVQDAKDPSYVRINDLLRKMALKYGVKTVATTDVHYVKPQDAEAHQTLRKMSEIQHSQMSGSSFNTDEYYLKSRAEIDELSFTDSEKDLTLEIANRCNVSIDFKRNRLPSYPYTPAGKTGIQYLRELVYDIKFQWQTEYKQRLEKELGDIEKLGFADYFLLVADVVGWAKSRGILTGPGRGSVGGSLVSFALGITNIDPLAHGLIWERFLNAGRKSLPDIDSDFQRSRRGEVIAYIKERFGNNKVTQLITFNKLAARAVLKEVFRAYGMPFEEANKITALLPFKNEEHTQITLDEAISMVPELQQYEKKYKAWFAIARSLEGCYKSIGTHASAVVISDKDFSEGEYPLCRSSDNKSLVFAWDMQNVDDLGLLKLDVLGLSTLDVLSDVIELVRQRHNKSVMLNDIKLDDAITYNLLGDGKTIGIFQLEKQLGKTWSKQLTPKSISEISDLISIIRPGPLECLAGDTNILIHSGTSSGKRYYQYKTIKELYDDYMKIEHHLYGRNMGGPPHLNIISVNESDYSLFKNKILKVVKSGIKRVYDIELHTASNNRSQSKKLHIKASADHKFLTRSFGWKKLSDLQPYDYICIHKKYFGGIKQNKHARHWKNFREVAFQNYVYSCIFCDWHDASLDVNHIDGNRYTNNSPDNLCYLCPNHHKMYSENKITKSQILEMRQAYKLINTDDIIYCKVNQIIDMGEEETYDICVDGEYHNYIANNFVVHNSGMHEEYKLVKENQKLPHYVHMSLKPILDTTYGALLYQEQVIEICKQLAGMSLIDADLVRKAMGKKKPEEMKKWKDVFINGCKARNIPESAASEIWSYIDKFSGYGFNKSHGIGYALTAYYTAYFKANYPIEFFCANLKNTHFAQDTFEDINQFVHDARLFGFDVIPPKLMYGNPDFNIIDNKQIVFGLSFLKGIGDKGIATAKIAYQNNQTADFDGFLNSAEKHSVNRRIMESLILGGALDSYNESRTQMLAKYNLFDALTDNEKNIIITHPTHNWINIVRAMADDARAEDMKKTWNVKIPNSRRRETLREAVVAFDGANPFDSEVDKVTWEKEFLGISLSGDETRIFRSPNTCSDVVNYGAAEMPINVAARVEKVKKHLTKTKQQEMAFLTIADHTAKIDNVVIFPFQWNTYKDSVFEGNIVRLKGRIDDRGSLIVNYLERLR